MNNLDVRIDAFVDVVFNKGGYAKILEGLQNTLIIAICGLIIGIVIGTLIATVRVIPKYKLMPRILNGICSLYVSLFRGTPIVVQLLIFHFVLFSPAMLNIPLSPVEVCILVFGLNSGAYISEIMRSGIQSVDAGQMEAGRAVGLSFGTTMIKIVIPQAIKNVIPAIGNELIALIKETSIVSMIGMYDLTQAAKVIGAGNNMASYVVPMTVAAAFYLGIVYLLTFAIKKIEERLRAGDKR